MPLPPDCRIRLVQPTDQDAVNQLILDGLRGHFGFLDATLNPDLDDIEQSYIERGSYFAVIECHAQIVATGALVEEDRETGRLVRMSVAQTMRGQGLGRQMVEHLVQEAGTRGYRRVVCETNYDWHDAIGLYRSCGFTEVGIRDGDRHFVREL